MKATGIPSVVFYLMLYKASPSFLYLPLTQPGRGRGLFLDQSGYRRKKRKGKIILGGKQIKADC